MGRAEVLKKVGPIGKYSNWSMTNECQFGLKYMSGYN